MRPAEATTVPIGPPPDRLGCLPGTAFALLVLALLFGGILFSRLRSDMALDGATLAEVLGRETALIPLIVTAVLAVLLLATLVTLVSRLPRATASREARVDAFALELLSHPKWWYRGDGVSIPWDDVWMISAPREIFSEGGGRSRRRVPREVLDLFLVREVSGLPEFAASTTVETTPPEGVHPPAIRVRVGGPGIRLAMSVRHLAEAIDSVRPDLFYRGTAVDQWFTPAPLPEPRPAEREPGPRPPDAAGTSPPGRARTPLRPTAAPVPRGPVWLDYRLSLGRTYGLLAALPLVAAPSYLAGQYLAQSDLPSGPASILLGLVGLVVMFPFMAAVIMLPFVLLSLPRETARSGILVSADGLEFVEKRRWALRRAMVRSVIDWDGIQAIVARESATVQDPLGNAHQRSVVDIYLRGDTGFQRPGVGVNLTTDHLVEPDSAATRDLVEFPAIRLRLPYLPEAERRGAGVWRDLPPAAAGPHEMPAHQLRPALHSFRPDLCHGFGDLASLWTDPR